MGKQLKAFGLGGPRPRDDAYKLALACQRTHRAWAQALGQAERDACSRAHRAAVEQLYHALERDLRTLAARWLERRVGRLELGAGEQLPLAHDAVDSLVFNAFGAVTQQLPGLSIDEENDVRARLLLEAERHLERV